MTKSELGAKLNERRGWLAGKKVKLDFGPDGVLLLDGVAGRVVDSDAAADTVIRVSWRDLEALEQGSLDPVSAMMQGRLRIDGDMANAMQLPGLIAKLRS